MSLRTYLVILAFVCGMGGLLLELVIFQRQQELDVSAAEVEVAMTRQQDINRLSDYMSHLFLSLDLLFGASETYMIDATQKQLQLSNQFARDLKQLAIKSDASAPPLSSLLVGLKELKHEVDTVSVQAIEPEFFVAGDQLDRVDRVTLQLSVDLQRLSAISAEETERARFHQASQRATFDTTSWFAGAAYILVVVMVLFWVARTVARPLNRVAVAADIALRDHLPFDAPIDGPIEVRRLAGHISTLVHSLERAVDSRTQFLTSMSHELRTPLNGVLGMTAVLLDSDLRTQDRKCIEVIRTSGESLLSIINELLDFARYEDGSIKLVLNNFSLEGLIAEVLDVTTPLAHQKRILLYLDMPLLENDCFFGDKNRLRQVLINLISNAVKFTHKGSVSLRIQISEPSSDRIQLHFSVLDTGIGVPNDKLDAIFEPFNQSDASITREYGGSGLGLAICTEIVGLMDSEISVSSVLGQGSEFSFVVQLPIVGPLTDRSDYGGYPEEIGLVFLDPIKRSNVETILQEASVGARHFDTIDCIDLEAASSSIIIEAVESNVAKINEFAAANPSITVYAMGYAGLLLELDEKHSSALSDPICPRALLSAFARDSPVVATQVTQSDINLQVLLVDDNPVNRIVAAKMIERAGAVVSQASNGQEALEKCRRHNFDVVFMDLQMPIMDGLTASKNIRAQNLHQPIIIAMTANAMEEDRNACFDAGMDDFLAKPVRLSEVDAKLTKIGADRGHLSRQGKSVIPA